MSNLIKSHPTALAPARDLRDVTRNCDEDVPLASGDPRWTDLSPARGDQATTDLERELTWRPDDPDKFVHAAFVSHRGAGKSTEILRLTERVRAAYTTVYFEATTEMDPFAIEAEDLLLNLVFAVEKKMRELETPLPGDLVASVARWFEDVVRSTKWAENFSAEAAAGAEGKIAIPFVGSLFGSVKALFKHEGEYRTEIKQALRKYPGTLLQSVNAVFDAANAILGKQPLLVVIDNLDRYPPDVIDRLLVAGADRIRALRCNLILTPPIGLLLKPHSAQLDAIYNCHFLYAVRLRRPDQAYDLFDGPGRDLMEQALARRIDLDAMIPEEAARDRLIAASGGALRELLHLVFQSALLARGDRILEGDVERAISRRKQRLRDLINANDWLPALLSIAERKQISHDEKSFSALFHYLAFKYNGDGWYDIHPLIAEIPEFEDARRGDRD
jgi:hypothetical protein